VAGLGPPNVDSSQCADHGFVIGKKIRDHVLRLGVAPRALLEAGQLDELRQRPRRPTAEKANAATSSTVSASCSYCPSKNLWRSLKRGLATFQ